MKVSLATAILLVTPATAFVPSVGPSASSTKLSVIDDKTEVREYFNTEGFNRWNKIYSESDDVNSVQLDIRDGHGQTISKILNWVEADGDIKGKTVCDCGCGVGSLAIPLAQMGKLSCSIFPYLVLRCILKTHDFALLSNIAMLGAKISASDISDSMANEADRRAKELGIGDSQAKFYTSDLESVSGKYDTVTCVDVAIHYPTEKMAEMVKHLCSLSDRRVLISFAPKTWYYTLLKKIGELFPGPSKTTRAYLHEEEVVRKALEESGFKVQREEMTATNFYFSRLLEATK